MKIEVREVIDISLNKLWDRDFYDTINKGDIIMYRGDSYQVIEIRTDSIKLNKNIILYRISRAINYYVLDKNDEIHKVADYNENCIKGGINENGRTKR